MKKRKLLEKILASTGNVRFNELVNLQNKKGKAKPYQVRQFLTLVEQYNLDLGEEA